MDFIIKNFKPMDKNTLKGSFTLVFGPLEINGLMLHVKDAQAWVSFPSKEYFVDGEKKYQPLFKIEPKQRWEKFQDWCRSQLANEIQAARSDSEPVSYPDDIPF